jgi:hypothetical protein
VLTGKAAGAGLVSAGATRARFEFEVHAAKRGPTGELQLKSGVLRFKSKSVTTFTRSGMTATWTGTGSWNSLPGYTFTATAIDGGRHSSGHEDHRLRASGTADRFEITIRNAGRTVVFAIASPVARGDIVVSSRSGDREHSRSGLHSRN